LRQIKNIQKRLLTIVYKIYKSYFMTVIFQSIGLLANGNRTKFSPTVRQTFLMPPTKVLILHRDDSMYPIVQVREIHQPD
jgi:hypothetical protein